MKSTTSLERVKKTNTAPNALFRPPNTDQGQDNNKDIALIPPEKFAIVSTHAPITNYAKCALMALVYNHPLARHPSRDKTIHTAKKYTY